MPSVDRKTCCLHNGECVKDELPGKNGRNRCSGQADWTKVSFDHKLLLVTNAMHGAETAKRNSLDVKSVCVWCMITLSYPYVLFNSLIANSHPHTPLYNHVV